MKIKIYSALFLLCFLSLCFLQDGFSQTKKPFEDALAIKKSLADRDGMYLEVLKKYHTDPGKLIDSNIFLKACKKLADSVKAASGKKRVLDPANVIQGSSSSFSFIPQAEAIDAIGTFIAERFKQEINIAFLDRFKQKLKEQKDLQTLLPTTHKFLIDNDPYNYTSFLESLRAALKQDLDSLPSSMPDFARNNKTRFVPSKIKEDQYIGLLMGLEAVNSYSQKNSSAKIILDACGQPEIKDIKAKGFKATVTVLKATVQELYNEVSQDWYDKGQMDAVLNDKDCRLIFLGLLYENRKAELDTLFTLTSKKGQDLIIPTIEYVNKIYQHYSILEDYRNKIKAIRETRDITVSEALEYAELTLNTLEKCLRAPQDIFGFTEKTKTEADTLIFYARKVLNIARNVQEKKYAEVFVNSLSLATGFLDSSAFKTEFTKYGNFAVNIVTAENSEAMVQALESAALPVGSYKIKRNSFSNISLNAFAGGFYGYEFLERRGDGSLPDNVEKESQILGFTAPIGIAFSFGSTAKYDPDNDKHGDYRRFGKDNKRVLTGGSWSIFLTALDVGAVTAFRLTNDKTETLPELKFSNVVAPGLYVVRGFKKVPLSWGLGAQYGPQVRKIEGFDPDGDLVSSWSARVFIGIDIPIINFYTRSEKK